MGCLERWNGIEIFKEHLHLSHIISFNYTLFFNNFSSTEILTPHSSFTTLYIICARSMPQPRKKYCRRKDYASLLVYLYLLVYGRHSTDRQLYQLSLSSCNSCVQAAVPAVPRQRYQLSLSSCTSCDQAAAPAVPRQLYQLSISSCNSCVQAAAPAVPRQLYQLSLSSCTSCVQAAE